MHALSLKEDSPRLLASKDHAEHEMTPHDEEVNRWAGVFVAVVGVMLMVSSFALDDGLL